MKQRSKKDCITKKPLIFRIKGLTAVELIIALSISVIVVAAAGFILLTQSGIIRFNRSVSTEQQRLNVQFASTKMVSLSARPESLTAGNHYNPQSRYWINRMRLH